MEACEPWLESSNLNEAAARLGPATALLLMHARGDEQVPYTVSEDLYAAAGEPKRLLLLPGGHHRSLQHDVELQAVSRSFIRTRRAGGLGPRRRTGAWPAGGYVVATARARRRARRPSPERKFVGREFHEARALPTASSARTDQDPGGAEARDRPSSCSPSYGLPLGNPDRTRSGRGFGSFENHSR